MADAPADDLKLAAEFPPATREFWRKLVDGVLKGAPFEDKLVSHTHDRLAIQPLYERAGGAGPIAGRPPGKPWQVMQRIDHPDPKTANAQARVDLENGTTGINVVGMGSIGAYGFGLPQSSEGIDQLLDGIEPNAAIAIELDLSPQTMLLPLWFAARLSKGGRSANDFAVRFGLDWLGAVALNGGYPEDWRDFPAPALARLARELWDDGFKCSSAVADGRVIHNAGGSEAQELAFALSAAVAYLRAFEAHEVTLDDARKMVFFRLAADTDQTLTIAKFRALRKLWARVETACGLAPEPAFISAETAWRMMTRRDPHLNLLRTTIAAFAAGVGGADAITVLPFTMALGLPDPSARRLARNIQLILMQEASIAQVSDPAAGSGGIEALTDGLCGIAWKLFQEIEAAGGAAAALERGLIQDKVAQTRAERERMLASGQDALVGVTLFPADNQIPVGVLDVPTINVAGSQMATSIKALAPMRLAAPFEDGTAPIEVAQ